jgi:RHS repeat-associated protein
MPSQPLKWTARELDGTGLYYLRSRYYLASTGRFLSEDALGLAAGLNLYVFAHNSPVGMRDPFGFDNSHGDDAGGFNFGDWYMGGMGGFSEFVDTWLMGGSTANFGDTAGRYDSGEASGWEVAGAGAWFGGNLVGAATGIYGAGKAAAVGIGRGAMGGFGGWCFPAGTPILTREGEKPIEGVKPGDVVLSADEETEKQSYQKVVRTFARRADELLTIRMEDGRSIEATPEHPFWVEGKGFVAAKRLARSDLLRDADGYSVAVVEVRSRRGEFRVYNFEVEGTHTYYAGGWWVHNMCPDEHLHHIFPQEFRAWFQSHGIASIDDFAYALPKDWHLQVIHKGWGGGYWNKQWKAFKNSNPNAGPDEIWEFAEQLMEQFGMDKRDLVPYH